MVQGTASIVVAPLGFTVAGFRIAYKVSVRVPSRAPGRILFRGFVEGFRVWGMWPSRGF